MRDPAAWARVASLVDHIQERANTVEWEVTNIIIRILRVPNILIRITNIIIRILRVPNILIRITNILQNANFIMCMKCPPSP